MAIFLFSLTGLPPLAGFVGKFYLFAAGDQGQALRAGRRSPGAQQRHLALLLRPHRAGDVPRSPASATTGVRFPAFGPGRGPGAVSADAVPRSSGSGGCCAWSRTRAASSGAERAGAGARAGRGLAFAPRPRSMRASESATSPRHVQARARSCGVAPAEAPDTPGRRAVADGEHPAASSTWWRRRSGISRTSRCARSACCARSTWSRPRTRAGRACCCAHHGIRRPLVSYYDAVERRRAPRLVEQMLAGREVALVRDAGTPGIADPATTWCGRRSRRAFRWCRFLGRRRVAALVSVAGLPVGSLRVRGVPAGARRGARRSPARARRRDPRARVPRGGPSARGVPRRPGGGARRP